MHRRQLGDGSLRVGVGALQVLKRDLALLDRRRRVVHARVGLVPASNGVEHGRDVTIRRVSPERAHRSLVAGLDGLLDARHRVHGCLVAVAFHQLVSDRVTFECVADLMDRDVDGASPLVRVGGRGGLRRVVARPRGEGAVEERERRLFDARTGPVDGVGLVEDGAEVPLMVVLIAGVRRGLAAELDTLERCLLVLAEQ